jgi:hypothetical protein
MAKKYLSETDFVEQFQGAPWDLEELTGNILSKVDPKSQLVKLARNVRMAQQDLDKRLAELEFELG